MIGFTAFKLLTLASTTFAQYKSYQPSTITDASQFNSIAAAIVSEHIPSSVLPSLAIAIQTAAASQNITGDINSLVHSALTAQTPPPFLASGLPAPLQTRVDDMLDSISALKIQVSGFTTESSKGVVGTVTIPMMVTQTVRNGSTIVTQVPAFLVNDTSTPTTSSSVIASSTAAPATAKSSGFAAPTQVPVAAGALLGMLGLIAAL